MIKACIFDLDGTLTDTVESIARGVNLALEYFGYAPRPVQEYNYYAGDGIDMAWRRALAAAGDAEGRHFQEGLSLCRKRFGENSLYRVKPYPQITETVEELKKRGIKTAVFSNKPHEAAVRVVEHVFGKGFLDVIQGQTPGGPQKTGSCRRLQDYGIFFSKTVGVPLFWRYEHRHGDRAQSGYFHRGGDVGIPAAERTGSVSCGQDYRFTSGDHRCI